MESGSELQNTNNAVDIILEDISAKDALRHFNKTIFPGIKEKFFPTKIKRTIGDILLGRNKNKKETEEEETNNYNLFGIAIAKGIFEFVIGDDTGNLKKLNLFLEVMYLEMLSTAYCNYRLDFNNCAKDYESKGETIKARIIKEGLEMCDKKFFKSIVTIGFTEDHVVLKNGYGTTLQTKEDFLGKSNQ